MTKHKAAHRRRKDAASRLRSTDIRAWCEEWEVHPDVRSRLLEAYAKGEDEWAIIRCLNRLAAAEQTRMKNRRRMKQRRKMNWAPASP